VFFPVNFINHENTKFTKHEILFFGFFVFSFFRAFVVNEFFKIKFFQQIYLF